MADTWTKQELADKADWEGGTVELILSYGLSADKLPPDVPDEVRAAWVRLRAAEKDEEIINKWLWSD